MRGSRPGFTFSPPGIDLESTRLWTGSDWGIRWLFGERESEETHSDTHPLRDWVTKLMANLESKRDRSDAASSGE